MSVRVNTEYLDGFIRDDEITDLRPYLRTAQKMLLEGKGAGNDYLGWVTLPEDYDREEFARIKAAAKRIQKSCDIFLVLGIGGSYLGARSAIEFVKSPLYNALDKDTPDIYFAGNNLSPTALCELLSICKGKDLCVNVISKSGTTTETAVAFRIFKDLLVEKYGEEGAKSRIFATDDEYVRGSVAFALGSFKNPEVIDVLGNALNDKSEFVRSMVVEAFGYLKDPKALDYLKKARDDSSIKVKGVVARVLRNM